MARKVKQGDNLLEFVPMKNEKLEYVTLENEGQRIIIPRDGWADKLVRKFAKTPASFKLDLDPMGSFVMSSIDGQKTIGDIGKEVKAKFGDDAEPLYERLGTYIQILRNNNFIELK